MGSLLLLIFIPLVLLLGVGLVAALVILLRRSSPGSSAPSEQSAPRPAQALKSDSALAAAALAPTVSLAGMPKRPLKPAPSIVELQPHFPDLEIISLLGQGGMGAVYRVRRHADGAALALKVVSAEGEHGEAFAARFLREAEALHRLSHPNIVAIRAHGRHGSWCWLLMDLVEGANLRQVVATGTLSPAQTLVLVPPLCSALQYAHDQGVVHRDLKPENILIDQQGLPHLVDFGLAKVQSGRGTELTGSGDVLGTLHYMAPEQVEQSRTVDHRADIYALGVILYELLTGRLPLGRFEPPSQNIAVDVRIDEVVLRALERDPARRWQQADHVQQAMGRISTPPIPDTTAIRPWGMELHVFLTLLHLSTFAGFLLPGAGFILPIVMWATCHALHPLVDTHGRIVLNWLISSLIYAVVTFVLCFILIGIPLAIALALCGLLFPLVGAIRASRGEAWRYPLSIAFLRHDSPAPSSETAARGLGAGCLVLLFLLIIGLVLFVAAAFFLFAAPHSAGTRVISTDHTPPAPVHVLPVDQGPEAPTLPSP